ncbi:tetraacyldisaccharide 4'-kinase [Niabella yanshanensis]|uniref:Tetraacyldisaccharide 4'-kinase n=1 Tax=Niabella yanshanensis TaxID=577386 RepID=A0ABZ0W811_9BACT|nr:tetraacyldisaccharide 4'-kinase [Niabella yanshanensis]WQD39423.1 tetraacyldisaccharide 4'-kinase [Niabella yanshanensis]
MNFSKLIRQRNIFLVPFSWLYKASAFVFHKLYDWKVIGSYAPRVATICVGNLSVGGTGKSPMVEYLLRLLQDKTAVAVISRGYRRKTKGFVVANELTTAADIGDEPMQFHQKFPGVTIAVGEERAKAIEALVEQKPQTGVIILDDAFQHRAVTPGFNILLTEYNNLFTKDGYLPAGSLRDLKSNYQRANIIVVTKCDPALENTGKEQIIKEIRPFPHQQVFFTAIAYGTPYQVFSGKTIDWPGIDAAVLVTGIANPQPLLDYLQLKQLELYHMVYADHHHFSGEDIEKILTAYNALKQTNKIILTTEKDAVRLVAFKELQDLPVVALPVQHQFLFNEGNIFDQKVIGFLEPKLKDVI